MEANLETKDLAAAASPSVAGHEDHQEVALPIPYQPENQSLNRMTQFPPLPSLLFPIREMIEVKNEGTTDEEREPGENSDHQVSVTIPEPPICRICDPDEENIDDVLLILGCRCRGPMSRMHRKCILQWYGMRMILKRNYKCEVCKAFMHPRVQMTVFHGVTDHENGGRDILLKALKSACVAENYNPPDDEHRLLELLHSLRDQSVQNPRRRPLGLGHHRIDVQSAAQDAIDDLPLPRRRHGFCFGDRNAYCCRCLFFLLFGAVLVVVLFIFPNYIN